jgi:hypothetical protein
LLLFTTITAELVKYCGSYAQKKYPGASLRLRNVGGANNRAEAELCHSEKSDFTFYHKYILSSFHSSALWLFKILHDSRERRSEAVEFLAALVKFLVGQKRSGEHLDKMGV